MSSRNPGRRFALAWLVAVEILAIRTEALALSPLWGPVLFASASEPLSRPCRANTSYVGSPPASGLVDVQVVTGLGRDAPGWCVRR